MNRRPTRTLAIAALLATTVAGCGVRLQEAPQPIEQTTQEPRPTPTIDRSVSPSSPTSTTCPTPSPPPSTAPIGSTCQARHGLTIPRQ